MNIAIFHRFGFNRRKPLEQSLVSLSIGEGPNGSVMIEWHDKKANRLILNIHDEGTLMNLRNQIDISLSMQKGSQDGR